MTPRLKNLVLNDFRSLKGPVVVPLDAQVVLVHGSNGMGKTSVLTGIELGLTGQISHLAEAGKPYQSHMAHVDVGHGSIELQTTAALDGGRTSGSVTFGDAFAATPLLDPEQAKFFANRCYLPQSALSRLLELYDDQSTGSESRLTQFVNELLGLDPLDALIDGLMSAHNVTRIRNVVPEYRRFEGLVNGVDQNIAAIRKDVEAAEANWKERRSALEDLLNEVDPLLELPEDLEERRGFELGSGLEEAELGAVGRLQANLDRVRTAWAQRGEGDPAARLAELRQALDVASKRLAEWQATDGARFAAIETLLAPILPDLPPFATDPVSARDQAEARARAETVRCQTLLTRATTATDTLAAVKATIQRANVRIAEIDADLAKSASDAQSLAKALATVAPHVHDETCPVCARDFRAEDKGSLSAFIASRIADLTSEAGRLQSLANERAAESKRLAEAQRQQLSAERELLPEQERADLASRIPKLNGALADLAEMTINARVGASIINDLAKARAQLNTATQIQEDTSSAVAAADQIVRDITSIELAAFPTVAAAFEVASSTVADRAEQAEADLSARSRARSLLSMEVEAASRLQRLRASLLEEEDKAGRIAMASETANARRLTSRAVADAADKIRSSLVTTVFNTSLNNRWRDLFVRLAPTENFVPAFELTTVKGKTEARLKTRHRSGVGYGTPGSMLSQGNLNTAALTLFLALHLSVPTKQPWLILDDPVQSMDDVHIAQFAALLRTLSKRLGRQIVIAVHERALFDYLALELSPAFSGDSLLTVEISRGPDGMSSASPKGFGFEADQAIAA
jgi:exonuclease SbcC